MFSYSKFYAKVLKLGVISEVKSLTDCVYFSQLCHLNTDEHWVHRNRVNPVFLCNGTSNVWGSEIRLQMQFILKKFKNVGCDAKNVGCDAKNAKLGKTRRERHRDWDLAPVGDSSHQLSRVSN